MESIALLWNTIILQPMLNGLVLLYMGLFHNFGVAIIVFTVIIRLVMTMRGGDRPKNAHKEFAQVSVMPKSCWEPWGLFRKPCEGRVQDNLRRWWTGGLRRVSAEEPFKDLIYSSPARGVEREIAPHPSIKPQGFLRQIVRAALPLSKGVILDPFMGSGSVLVAAMHKGKDAIGFEIYPHFTRLAERRIAQGSLLHSTSRKPNLRIIEADARDLPQFIKPESVDLCVTSPPYWDILTQKRTADSKEKRPYGGSAKDLAGIPDYKEFLSELSRVFANVLTALKPGKYCIVIVMDIRKKDRFYPFHSDLAAELTKLGFIYDDLIIWNRQAEYNNLRPLGYPYVFRVNKVHEFILIFKKPPKKGRGRNRGKAHAHQS